VIEITPHQMISTGCSHGMVPGITQTHREAEDWWEERVYRFSGDEKALLGQIRGKLKSLGWTKKRTGMRKPGKTWSPR